MVAVFNRVTWYQRELFILSICIKSWLLNLVCDSCYRLRNNGTLFVQVDKHIRRLDADLARFEAELKEKPPGLSVGKLKAPRDGKAVKDKPSKDKAGLSITPVEFVTHSGNKTQMWLTVASPSCLLSACKVALFITAACKFIHFKLILFLQVTFKQICQVYTRACFASISVTRFL